MHKQKEVKINVDEKIQPLIQFIFDRLPGVTTTASCIGGDSEQNESDDCYILLIVQNHNHLNHLMELCSVWHCQYIKPNSETGNIPTYRISISDLDEALIQLSLVDENYIF